MFEFSIKDDVNYQVRRAMQKMILPCKPDFLYIDDVSYAVTLRAQLEGTDLRPLIQGGTGDPLFANIGVKSFDPCYEKIAEELLNLLLHPELRENVPVIEAVYK